MFIPSAQKEISEEITDFINKLEKKHGLCLSDTVKETINTYTMAFLADEDIASQLWTKQEIRKLLAERSLPQNRGSELILDEVLDEMYENGTYNLFRRNKQEKEAIYSYALPSTSPSA